MIDLPPGARPSSQAGATSPAAEIRPAELARMQTSQAIEAVVLESTLRQQAGTAQKPVYEILLKASAALASNPPLNTTATSSAVTPATPNPAPLTQITPNSITLLRQGQSILIKTAAEFPLQPGAQLLATVSPTKGVVLHRILPPQLAATINQALKQLVPQQQSLSPLFRMVEQISAQPISGLPKAIQPQLSTLIQLLPKLEQLKTAEQLRNALNNSGLFLENKIQKALVQTVQAKSATQSPLSQSLKELTTLVKEAVNKRPLTVQDTSAKGASVDLGPVLKYDIKQQLISLQARLETAQSNIQNAATSNLQPTNTPSGSGASGAAGITPPGTAVGTTAEKGEASAKSAPTPGTPPNNQSLTNKSERTADTYSPPRSGATNSHEAAFVPTRPAPNKTQGYSAVQSSSVINTTYPLSKTSAETFLLPPLPGNITLQPQARAKLQAAGDMADALVSILLKQVKGALSRITLHQLASHTRNQDPTAPQPQLSFELPILHQNQVQIFQFLIEEREPDSDQNEKKQGKRWVVQMAFDIEGLGPMLCQISLVGHSASVSFWAEWENTLQHTRNHFDYLQKVLTEMGLKVEKLQGHLGIPKTEQAILQNQLVDIHT